MPRCEADGATCALLSSFIAYIVNPILILLASLAVLVFVWGVVQYLWKLRGGDTNNTDGKQHMLWGLVGLFVIVSTVTILHIISNTVSGLLP